MRRPATFFLIEIQLVEQVMELQSGSGLLLALQLL